MGGAHRYYLMPFQGFSWFLSRLAQPDVFIFRPFRAWFISVFLLRWASPAGISFRPFRALADFFCDLLCLTFLSFALSGLGLYLVFFYGGLLPPVLSYALSGLRLISLVIGFAWCFCIAPFQGLVYIWFSFTAVFSRRYYLSPFPGSGWFL